MPRGFDAFLLLLAVLFPGGGHVRIENVKLDFKDKAYAKVGSLGNTSHIPGGGNIMVKKKKKHTNTASCTRKVSAAAACFCTNKEEKTPLT